MVATRFHITALTPRTITRARGLMAYEQLRSRLDTNNPIEIDLRGEYPLSLSFLDEFIRHLSSAGYLNRITFTVKERDALRKLARVAHIRGVDIWYLETDSPRRKVDPLPSTATEAVFLEDKLPNDEL